jgi:RNA polymerase sigma factor (sigma-70 family)
MSLAGSMTVLIRQLKAGEEVVLSRLHARYGPRLIAQARKKLQGAGSARRVADEEDVVQEAFWSFYLSLKAGKLPKLENRADFLALLTHIVACQAHIQLTRDNAQKRRTALVPGYSVWETLAAEAEPTPLESALLNDCYHHFLDSLPEPLRETAELYLAGLTQTEIAAKLDCVPRTVQRKIGLILRRWQELAESEV